MKMSLAQRVFLSWIFALVFLIMLVLKLDSKINWNWFLIFLPVWTFDNILILIQVVEMAGRCKPDFDPRDEEKGVMRRLWYLAALLLKLAFCLTLCFRLEKVANIWVSVVCVPLWLLLGGALVELGYSVLHHRRD
ncbi:transmembrane protein 60 [Fundulus heteroclitus]|uniref:transmembrane protein 60 n=1 Tax=Fundulus heteroclitus TaxID=8078 RepID=UPI00165A3411|nr:transmembrane protein 60 [Fundulus heteroclitus]